VKRRHDPNQILIDWTAARPSESLPAPREAAPPPSPVALPWDFSATFPQPTQEAVDAGVITDEQLDDLPALHDEHARELLGILESIDTVKDAERRGVDPRTGKPPRSHASREKLRRHFQSEPERLAQSYNNLMGAYEDAFGAEAAEAFNKSVRARHAGVEVVADPAYVPRKEAKAARRNASVRMPTPEPLAQAIEKGHFGEDEDGPITPSAEETQAITEHHAERLIELLGRIKQVKIALSKPCGDRARLYREKDLIEGQFKSALAMYAADFGQDAANQLEMYARHEARMQERVR
jgi:hypothetical protein